MKTLRDKLAYYIDEGGLDLDGTDKRLKNLLDKAVIKEHDGCVERWPRTHKFVYVWWELDTGHAVGLNENPGRGISFPIIRIKK